MLFDTTAVPSARFTNVSMASSSGRSRASPSPPARSSAISIVDTSGSPAAMEIDPDDCNPDEEVLSALYDDLNTPKALAKIFSISKLISQPNDLPIQFFCIVLTFVGH